MQQKESMKKKTWKTDNFHPKTGNMAGISVVSTPIQRYTRSPGQYKLET